MEQNKGHIKTGDSVIKLPGEFLKVHRWDGAYQRGAMKTYRAQKRTDAERRNEQTKLTRTRRYRQSQAIPESVLADQ